MKILAIDTSTKFLTLGLSKNSKLLGQLNLELGRKLSDEIIRALQKFLKKHKIGLSDLDGFAVGVGPGSFTGLRIGLSTIKGFSLVLNKPIVGVSSLDILAESIAAGSEKLICPIIDAKRELVYSCVYKKTSKLKRTSKYMLVSVKDLLNEINQDTIFLGDGIVLYKDAIKRKLGKKAHFASEKSWYPKAIDLLSLSRDKFKTKKAMNAHELQPLYLYPKECQVSNLNKLKK